MYCFCLVGTEHQQIFFFFFRQTFHYEDFQCVSLGLPTLYSSSAILLVVNNLKGSKCVSFQPFWEISLCCVCILNILVKTEVPEKPVCYIQVVYVIKKQGMQRISIKTCSISNSRLRKPGVNKNESDFYLQHPEVLQADGKKPRAFVLHKTALHGLTKTCF